MAEVFDVNGITQARLKELVYYDPVVGVFINKENRLNSKPIGSFSATLAGNGSMTMHLDGKVYAAHRLAWLYMTGDYPDYLIDHINRIRTDNRFCNLRQADRSQNGQNANKKKNNTSGVTGVWKSETKKGTMWHAEIFVRGVKHRLGSSPDKEKAIAFRKAGEEKYFGEFAAK